MRSRPEGAEAAVIGEVLPEPEGMVFIHTGFGGTRVVDMLIGDPLPRIC
jgi:hydrogenase expression/formation protein HypE